MKKLTLALLSSAFLLGQTPDLFLAKPYLQLGDAPKLANSESLVLLWQTADAAADWRVELRTSKDSAWRAADRPSAQIVAAPGVPAHIVFRATLKGLIPGEEFHYRVLESGKVVFDSPGRARKPAAQPYRFALFGDCGQNSPAQKAVTYQVSLAKPDFVFIPGDIVYSSGRISEYRTKFFPIYNSDQAAPETGAPLLRSIPFIAAPGNHDSALQNFQRFPDALAYFLYWDQPLNGIAPPSAAPRVSHDLNGSTPESQSAFLLAAKPRYPVMANFSFDYGNAHWTILDSNPYMDWTNPALRDWVAKDLAAAGSATWRFIGFHHPGFNSSKAHFTDQWMRSLAPVFEEGKVDMVFAGHVHNYQRSFPLTFTPNPQTAGPRGELAGDWKLDHSFKDGSNSKPQGVIYIVSGAGAGLYNPEQQADPATWQPFTDKFFSTENSFTVVDVEGKTLRFKQVSASGKQLDAFKIVK